MSTKNETISLFLYQRMVDKKDKSGKFPKDKASFDDVSWDVNYTKACREKLTAEMLSKNLRFPIKMTLIDSQYWPKPKEFIRNDGTKGVKQVLIIKDYVSIEQDEFRTQDLHALASAIKAGREAMAELDESTEE